MILDSVLNEISILNKIKSHVTGSIIDDMEEYLDSYIKNKYDKLYIRSNQDFSYWVNFDNGKEVDRYLDLFGNGFIPKPYRSAFIICENRKEYNAIKQTFKYITKVCNNEFKDKTDYYKFTLAQNHWYDRTMIEFITIVPVDYKNSYLNIY